MLLDVSSYLKRLNSPEVTLEELRTEAATHLAARVATEYAVPRDISVGAFTVNNEAVLHYLADKRNALVHAVGITSYVKY